MNCVGGCTDPSCRKILSPFLSYFVNISVIIVIIIIILSSFLPLILLLLLLLLFWDFKKEGRQKERVA